MAYGRWMAFVQNYVLVSDFAQNSIEEFQFLLHKKKICYLLMDFLQGYDLLAYLEFYDLEILRICAHVVAH